MCAVDRLPPRRVRKPPLRFGLDREVHRALHMAVGIRPGKEPQLSIVHCRRFPSAVAPPRDSGEVRALLPWTVSLLIAHRPTRCLLLGLDPTQRATEPPTRRWIEWNGNGFGRHERLRALECGPRALPRRRERITRVDDAVRYFICVS